MRLPQRLPYRELVFLSLLLGQAPAAFAQVDYSREIRPILAKRCYSCHGPGVQEAGLRVDDLDSIKSELESGEHAIVPGKSDASELIARVSSNDEFVRMPPEGKPLSPQEIKLLEQWIAEGADWESHWAFKDVVQPKVPEVNGTKWVKTPIDAFVLKRLEKGALSPNSLATKLQLIRRATYDLTGIPPTQQEVESFLSDQSPQAFEKVIDRLLASEHYGEQWARFWLDVVRYAETNSFERDSLKPHAWRYRDYVIRSLNADKPYDQFVREQLAGDELDEVTSDSIIATGYYRLGIWDDEPADRALAKYDQLDDLVSTTGQTFLGLTINCARCHDHKIDPITQADYYSMVSFFNGIKPMGKSGPNIERAIFENDESKREYDQEVKQIQERRNDLQARVRAIENKFRKEFEKVSLADVQQPDLANLEYRFYRDTFEKLPNFDDLKAETIEKLDPPYFDIRPATREDFFGFVFVGELIVPKDGKYTFWLDSDDGARLLLDGKDIINYDGIHDVGKPAQRTVELKQGRVPIRLDYFQGQHGKGLAVRWTGPGFKDRYLSVTTANNVLISDPKSRPLPDLIRSAGRKILGPQGFKEYNDLNKEMKELFAQKVSSDYALCVTGVPNPPEMFILNRGNPRLQGDPVAPAFPVLLTSLKPEVNTATHNKTSGRRLALANWIASPENKMTARVIVNRMWQHHFGRGIVRSTNNFGLLGDVPTHPKLLDWLASDFMQHGWKMKRLHKMIMMSSVWQQSSAPNPTSYEVDPQNNLFWKYNMRRLSAEEIRDSLFAATGELNEEMYGPGFYPIIPAAVLAGQSKPGAGWGDSSPEVRARRAIYIHVKRSLITPFLADFDFCETDSSCADRFRTVQPTQALGMLNSEFLQERAVKFSARLKESHPGDLNAQIRESIWLTCQRPATESDLERGRKLVSSLKTKHGLNDDQALDLYALMVLNLNEFMYLD